MTDDPHIHVERRVVQAGGAYRNLIAATLGAAPDAPAEVTAGCGIRSGRPSAMSRWAHRDDERPQGAHQDTAPR